MAPRAAQARPPGTADKRLQLRETLDSLEKPDLQQQAGFAVETLLRDADAPLLEFFVREALRLGDCVAGSVRRLNYRLAAQALRTHSAVQWEAGSLPAVRDLLIARIGLEDHGPAAAELSALAGQVAATCIEAYCREQYPALGQASKAGLSRTWLCDLLLAPLLRAACKGPARTRVANACFMAHGVLQELRRWAKSAGVLHAAVECLKQMLKMTSSGALALCAGEALLPVQSCIVLLGPRLKAAALVGILQLCTQAMHRGEWQVRKAAADTLAVLAETLTATDPGPMAGSGNLSRATSLAIGAAQHAAGSGEGQQQEQGLPALERLAPAILAAVEQHLKYDRIPQVRQAAAALLPRLQRLCRSQQQGGQLLASQLHGAVAEAAAGKPSEPPLEALNEQVRHRGNLKAIIAERRQQLQESGWAQAAAAAKVWRGGGGAGDSSEPTSDSIPAWAGGAEGEGDAAGGGRQEISRPPSAAAFHAAAAAMQHLHAVGVEPVGAATKRRGWGSQPASPTKQPGEAAGQGRRAGRDIPVEIFIPSSPPPPALPPSPPPGSLPADGGDSSAAAGAQRQDVWRHNPLAQSDEQPRVGYQAAGLVPAPAAPQQAVVSTAVPSVHHIEHAQFSLRLQSVPPAAELRLNDGSSVSQAAAPESVRFWVQERGADVGIEFALCPEPGSTAPGTMLRYWLREGRLCHERVHPQAAAAAAVQHASGAGAAHATMRSPRGQHTPGAGASAPQQQAQAGLPTESPLASLATAAMPSFSPDKAGGTPTATAPGWRDNREPSSPSAGARSVSPNQQDERVTARWAASLRPSGEQLLPGLPDWDRTRGGRRVGELDLDDITRSRGASPSRPGSRTVSPGRHDSHASSPSASDTRPTPTRWQEQPEQQQPTSPLAAGSPTAEPQQQQQGEGHDEQPTAATPPFQQRSQMAHNSGQPQEEHAAAAQGPLTAMVTRAVSKLQQLHELEEELQLPFGSTLSAGPSLAASLSSFPSHPHGLSRQHSLPGRRHEEQEEFLQQPHLHVAQVQQQPQQAQQPQQPQQQRQAAQHAGQQTDQQEPRRSPEPVLSAIQEGSAEGGPHSSGSHRWPRSPSGSTGSSRRECSPSVEMERLQRLHEQLQLNMLEIQSRMGEQSGLACGRSGERGGMERGPSGERSGLAKGRSDERSSPGNGSRSEQSSPSRGAATADASTDAPASSSEGMPAAWDAQEQLPPPMQHRYPPRRRHWHEPEEQQSRSPGPQQQQQGIHTGSLPSAASSSGSDSDGEWPSAADGQAQSQGSSGFDGNMMLAMNNPLFGSSRPGTAQGEAAEGVAAQAGVAAQGLHGMLPPKRSLAAGRRRTNSSEGAPGSAGQPGMQRQQPAPLLEQQRHQRHSPQLSTGPMHSMGSMGSGFSGLRHELEAEVQQFLRGSLAGTAQPAQLQQQMQRAAQAPGRPSSHQESRGGRVPAHGGDSLQAGGSPASSHGSPAVARQQGAGRDAAAGQQAWRRGSLDLAAILGSRPASPTKLAPLADSSSENGGEPWEAAGNGAESWQTAGSADAEGWHTARMGAGGWQTARSGAEGWQTARSGAEGRQVAAEAQELSGRRGLWSSSSSEWAPEADGGTADTTKGGTDSHGQQHTPPSPGQQQQRRQPQQTAASPGRGTHQQQATVSPGQTWHQQQTASPARQPRHWQEEEAESGTTADLHLLRIRSRPASPGISPDGNLAEVVLSTYSPDSRRRLEQLKAQLGPQQQQKQQQQQQQQQPGAASPGQGSSRRSSPGVPPSMGSSGTRAASSAASQPGSPAVVLPLRETSPEIPGLRISRRQACMLQSAVGRMAGNPGENADVEDMQGALQDVLVAQTAHVQAHYQRAAAERLGALRRQHGHDPARLARVLHRETAALREAQEAFTRRELTVFVEEALPRLAEVLSSRSRLLRCFEAAAEGAEDNGGEE